MKENNINKLTNVFIFSSMSFNLFQACGGNKVAAGLIKVRDRNVRGTWGNIFSNIIRQSRQSHVWYTMST